MDECQFTPKLKDVIMFMKKQSPDIIDCVFIVMEYVNRNLSDLIRNEQLTNEEMEVL